MNVFFPRLCYFFSKAFFLMFSSSKIQAWIDYKWILSAVQKISNDEIGIESIKGIRNKRILRVFAKFTHRAWKSKRQAVRDSLRKVVRGRA